MSAPRTTAESLVRCTRCGLCLAECPTFADRDEARSPRGRVWSLLELLAGSGTVDVADTPTWECTACGLCLDACPTGVDVPGALATLNASHVAEADPRAVTSAELDLAALSRGATGPMEVAAEPVGGVLLYASPQLRTLRPDVLERAHALLRSVDVVPHVDPAWTRRADHAGGVLAEVGDLPAHDSAVQLLQESTSAGTTVVAVDTVGFGLGRVLPGSRAVALTDLGRDALRSTSARWASDDRYALDPFVARAAVAHEPEAVLPWRLWHVQGRAMAAAPAVEARRRLWDDVSSWLAGRVLVTADPRALVMLDRAHFYLDGPDD